MPKNKEKKYSSRPVDCQEAHQTPQPSCNHTAVRINKALAEAGICSRRAADKLVLQGLVMVNGTRVDTPGFKVIFGKDNITVEGKPVCLVSPADKQYTYLLANKPIEMVTTAHDPEGRPTVMDLIPASLRHKRLFPVGRLDFFSEGLLLLTDDGELAHRLTHPSWHMPKTYHVQVRGTVRDDQVERMCKGMTLAEGERLAPVKVEILARSSESTLLALTLMQGLNRQIRRMCRDLDLVILSLCRIKQGPIALGILPKGHVRPLSTSERTALFKAVGLVV